MANFVVFGSDGSFFVGRKHYSAREGKPVRPMRRARNLPSIKSLQQIKDVTPADARAVRAVLELGTVDAVTAVSDAAREYVARCYNRPPLQLVKLTAADEILRTYGVEGIAAGRGRKSPAVEYCNTGDTYATTLLWIDGRYRVGCWGDVVERGDYD